MGLSKEEVKKFDHLIKELHQTEARFEIPETVEEAVQILERELKHCLRN
jgi:hypothetical protein